MCTYCCRKWTTQAFLERQQSSKFFFSSFLKKESAYCKNVETSELPVLEQYAMQPRPTNHPVKLVATLAWLQLQNEVCSRLFRCRRKVQKGKKKLWFAATFTYHTSHYQEKSRLFSGVPTILELHIYTYIDFLYDRWSTQVPTFLSTFQYIFGQEYSKNLVSRSRIYKNKHLTAETTAGAKIIIITVEEMTITEENSNTTYISYFFEI